MGGGGGALRYSRNGNLKENLPTGESGHVATTKETCSPLDPRLWVIAIRWLVSVMDLEP